MSPETAPEAPPVIFEMQCTTCGDASQAAEDFEDARTWAFTHLGRHPSHTGFREVVHRFWRATLKD